MPHGKLGKVRLLKNGGEGHQTEDQMATANLQLHFNSSGKEGRDHHYDRQSKCCTPRACRQPQELIDSKQPGTSVRVICNNDECTEGIWMHKDCFEDWEEHILHYLRTCGRARSWNDKQRAQNLWTKKGYDLAYKACDCLCERGHIRKDLDYIPHVEEDSTEHKKQRQHHKRNDKPLPIVSARSQPIPMNNGGGANARPRLQIRNRTVSMSSTGSSPPGSASPGGSPRQCRSADNPNMKFEFSLTTEQAASGNIFHHRPNLSAFNKLPPQKRNPYHIKMDDEGPYGNDEIRCFVLSALSTRRVTKIPCVVCGSEMKVFDRYPLVDGTMFLTPQRYISDIVLQAHGHAQYMNAVCMMCAEGNNVQLHCKQCDRQWDGSALQVGTMYSYDIFAASPCCLRRLKCKSCQMIAVDPGQNMSFFSQFSRPHQCQHCRATGYHFVKQLSEIFYIRRH